MALHRRDTIVNQVKETIGEVKEMVMPKKEDSNKLDIFILRDLLARRGEEGLVLGLNKAIDFYTKLKEEEKWGTSKELRVKNISDKPHNAGRWKVDPGEIVILPEFEVERILRDFPEKFEVVEVINE